MYALPADALRTMLAQLLTLEKAHGAGGAYPAALGPQPILIATGLEGAHARGLRQVVLEPLGELRLARPTMMIHDFPDSDARTFSRFDRAGDARVATEITGLAAPRQMRLGTGARVDALGRLAGDNHCVVLARAVLASKARPAQPTAAELAGFALAIDAQPPREPPRRGPRLRLLPRGRGRGAGGAGAVRADADPGRSPARAASATPGRARRSPTCTRSATCAPRSR